MKIIRSRRFDLLKGQIPEWALETAEAMMTPLRIKDTETYAHCQRVGEAANQLAKSMGLDPYQQVLAKFAGFLHDVGKVGIPTEILNKPAKLTDEEFAIMRLHPEFSAEIVKPLIDNPFFAELYPAVRHHHERIDGRGYPHGLKGAEIPLLARVILVVDTVDAMSFPRSYRKGLPFSRVQDELQKFAGSQFDPEIVDIYLSSHGIDVNLKKAA